MRRVLLSLALLVGFASAASAQEAALVIEEGSVTRRQVVAIGRDLLVHGEAESDVAALNGTVRVTGTVKGDVIVLGGDVLLSGSAQVGGDVFVLGGLIEAGSGAVVDGRSVSYPSIGSAWLILLEGPTLGLSPFSGVVLGAKLALVAAWLAWAIFLFAVNGHEMLATSEAVTREPFRNFFVGLAGVFALFLTALFLSTFAPALVGLPLLFIVVLVALFFKLWGMVAVFHAAGAWMLARSSGKRWMPLNVAVLGLLVLGVMKVLPWVGTWGWTIATFVGVGASLTTKFGRDEAWFATSGSGSRLSRAH